jgi:hypothetical protein
VPGVKEYAYFLKVFISLFCPILINDYYIIMISIIRSAQEVHDAREIRKRLLTNIEHSQQPEVSDDERKRLLHTVRLINK